LATIAGLEQTDGNALRLCRSLKATPFQIFWSARVPFALPHIFAGLKIAATLAVTGVVIGEFMTADSGLGFLIINASSRFDGKSMFAAILMLCVTGLVLFFVVVAAQQGCKKWYYGR
jgi:NitT/TauT family transport system permease protein